MIRKWDAKETRPLLTLWLESTIHAHPFINETYWHESVAVVRDVYLPAARTWVWEENATIKGFVSVMESRFIGALFVAPDEFAAASAARCWTRSNSITAGSVSRFTRKTFRR